MSIFSDNIVLLRGKKNMTQQELADVLILTRSRYVAYEYGRTEPPIDVLIRISNYYNVSIDLLVRVDIRKYPVDNMMRLPENRIVLPITVDSQGENYIEIVSQKASMGYLQGFSDHEYIEKLARMKLPFLQNGKYRAFLADGDSMPPFADGSYIIGEYVEQIEDLKSGKEYIFITSEGITYKTFVKQTAKSIIVSADNTFYEPYEILLENILEIWKYVRGILPENYHPGKTSEKAINTILQELKTSIKELDDKVSVLK